MVNETFSMFESLQSACGKKVSSFDNLLGKASRKIDLDEKK